MNKEKAKELLLNYLNHDKSLNNNTKAKFKDRKLEVCEIELSDTVIYNLKTFVKIEQSENVYLPSNESPSNQVPTLANRDNFPKETRVFTQISAESIKCHNCLGSKSWPCSDCKSKYQEYCEKCSTNPFNTRCDYCYNKMYMSTCKGNGGLKLFNKKTLIEDCIYDVSIKCKDKSIPLSIILKSKGSLIVNEHNFKLRPISHFPDNEIFNTSNTMLSRHEAKVRNSPNWEMISQNQQLIAIPVVKCVAKYNKKIIKFTIIGENHNIHLNDDLSCCSIF